MIQKNINGMVPRLFCIDKCCGAVPKRMIDQCPGCGLTFVSRCWTMFCLIAIYAPFGPARWGIGGIGANNI